MISSNGKYLIILLLICGMSGCLFNPQFSSWTINRELLDEDYDYDAETILQTIEEGKVTQSTFYLHEATGEEVEVENIFWGQNDYLSLAEGFHQWYLGDMAQDWMVLEMEFVADCEDVRKLDPESPDALNWRLVINSFFRRNINLQNGIPNLTVNRLLLVPRIDNLLVNASVYQPNPYVAGVELPEWEVLDSATMKINAEDAYRIAEKAGGNAFDHCRIRAINSLDDEYSGWYIYYRRNGSRSFDIVVNDRSGDYEIISE